MKVFSYRIIRRKYRFLTILLVIVLSLSLAISASYINSITYSLNSYMAGRYPIIADKNSRFGFTGLLDISGIIGDEKISSHISPEIITPIYANNSLTSLRGVYPKMFRRITPYRVIIGNDLSDDDITGVLVGKELFMNKGLKPGDTIIITSFWNKNPIIAYVIGVIDVERPFSKEIIANIHLSRLIRGLNPNYVNIIRLDPEKEDLKQYILDKLPANKTVILRGVEQFTYYAKKIGISPHIFLIALIPSMIISSISVKYLIDGLNDEHRDIYETLEILGYRGRDIKYLVIYNLLKYVVIGVIIGIIGNILLLYLIDNIIEIRFLIPIYLSISNPLIPTYTLVTLLTIIIVSILSGRLSE